MKNLLGLTFGLLLTLNVSAQSADMMPPEVIPPSEVMIETLNDATRLMPPEIEEQMKREMGKMQNPETMRMEEEMKHEYMEHKKKGDMKEKHDDHDDKPMLKKILCMLGHGVMVLIFLALATFIVRKSWDCAGKKK